MPFCPRRLSRAAIQLLLSLGSLGLMRAGNSRGPFAFLKPKGTKVVLEQKAYFRLAMPRPPGLGRESLSHAAQNGTFGQVVNASPFPPSGLRLAG